MASPRALKALTMVELLVVLGVLALVAGVALLVWRPDSAHRDAAALARTLTSARWLAVASGTPSVLVARDGAVHLVAAAPPRCDLQPTGEPVWAATRPLSLQWPAPGLVFGAHGRPLRCDGSAVGNTTITLRARDGSRAAVIVASLGRVRWERR